MARLKRAFPKAKINKPKLKKIGKFKVKISKPKLKAIKKFRARLRTPRSQKADTGGVPGLGTPKLR